MSPAGTTNSIIPTTSPTEKTGGGAVSSSSTGSSTGGSMVPGVVAPPPQLLIRNGADTKQPSESAARERDLGPRPPWREEFAMVEGSPWGA